MRKSARMLFEVVVVVVVCVVHLASGAHAEADPGLGWTDANFTQFFPYWGVDFWNATHGAFGGSDHVWATSDSGKTWNTLDTPKLPGFQQCLYNLACLPGGGMVAGGTNENMGALPGYVAVAGSDYLVGDHLTALYWKNTKMAGEVLTRNVHAWGSQGGFVLVGLYSNNGGAVILSDATGQTLASIAPWGIDTEDTLPSAAFVSADASVYVVAGGCPEDQTGLTGLVQLSKDGGKTFGSVVNTNGQFFNDLVCDEPTATCVVVGQSAAGPVLWLSTDLGATWNDVSPTNIQVYCVLNDVEYVAGTNTWWAGGGYAPGGANGASYSSMFMTSTDGGKTWTASANTGDHFKVNGMSFSEDGTQGWAVTQNDINYEAGEGSLLRYAAQN